MNWSTVGEWIKANAGPGASLVGSLLTGNIAGAVAAGVSIVSGATGTMDPTEALKALQTDPATMVRLKELAVQDEASVREHIRAMAQIEAENAQAEHKETQTTIREGDGAEDIVVRRTRPFQSWISLFGALAYVGLAKDVSLDVLIALLTLPWAYAGLREVGKGIASWKTGAK